MRRMTPEDITTLSTELGFPISAADAERFQALTDYMIDTVDRFDDVARAQAKPAAPRRDPGRRPARDEDPLNAVLRVVDVAEPAASGVLDGLNVVMKDNIPVAGVPMSMGSDVLTDFVPSEDAELTRRVLAAGGRIVATTNMEAFAFSGGGETSGHGRVENPFDRARTASGSSTGSAVALWYDGVDLAWGTDTGGSCRIPASWSGVLGLKPTHGLVPFSGIPTSDWRFDHAGPLARSVEIMARGMDAVVSPVVYDDAEYDAPARIERPEYAAEVAATGPDLTGVRIGLVRQGFRAADDPDAAEGTLETADAVRAAAERFAALGAEVVDVDLDVLAEGGDVMFAAMLESATAATFGWPTAYHWLAESSPEFAAALSTSLATRGDHLPDNFKAVLMVGTYLNRQRGGEVGARAHQLAAGMRADVDAALEGVDVLMMPTTSHTPFLARDDVDGVERSLRGWGMMHNVPLFNLTGHPAISMPAAESDGLPVGVMAVARRHDDVRLLTLARAYELGHGWSLQDAPFDWTQPTTFAKGQ
ncbi:amidase family protein [Microbacterium sp. SLBN-146]|uniref:amidase family protein n=1 Tax=Microbacterium sp. SLBN-146 TaxID=2768457 RepID=UPI0011523ABD|nr:amidase family protein [Microbacterium sp. SLBN-146]TQJ30920.1 amidase [Microbacterium sp. SLBN-146]